MRQAILIPCFNEERTIGAVVRDFRAALPGAAIYVYNNNSTDRTAEEARAAGAHVRTETQQGKGNVVRRMFADIEADIYLLVDGDGTYVADAAPSLVARLKADGLDMVVAKRLAPAASGAYRTGHEFGNRMLTRFVAWLFGGVFGDMLSGYRVFSRRFVKSFPAISSGFEIETELTIHAMALRMPVTEVETIYLARPAGSSSKLRTYYDGARIVLTSLLLFKEERPLFFFTYIFALLSLVGLGLGLPIVVEFMATHLVPRFPTAILATGIMLLAFLSLACGMILDSVTRGRREMLRILYLQTPGVVALSENEGAAGAPE